MKRALDAAGIGTAIYYYPVPFRRVSRRAGHHHGEFPHAEAAAAETLALAPIYGELTEEQQAYMVSTLAATLAS